MMLCRRYCSDEVMDLASSTEKTFVEFFANVKGALRGLAVDGPAKWGPREHEFADILASAKDDVRAALCNDIDTPVSGGPALGVTVERRQHRIISARR